MRKLLTLTLLLPTIALADETDDFLLNQFLDNNRRHEAQVNQAYGLPVQPVLPVPQDKGPWGTGYSIVTTTRPTQDLLNRDMTGSETVQRIVPNDYLGQPMKGPNLRNW